MKYLFWTVAIAVLGSMMVARYFEGSPKLFDANGIDAIWGGPQGAIAARGLPPQIELITKAAEESGWAVKCKARDGELTVVEFTPTLWAHFGSGQAAYERVSVFATSSDYLNHQSVDGEPCGSGPSGMSKGVGRATLDEVLAGYGTLAEFEPLFEIADQCELRDLIVRPLTAAEIEWIGGDVPDDWQGLVLRPTETNVNQAHCWSVIASQDELSEFLN